MRVSSTAMSSEEFRALAVRISKYVDFTGCDTIESVTSRIKAKKSKKLDYLADRGFGWRLMLEKWINPHPDYKKILGIDDDEYESLVEEAEESKTGMREFYSLLDYSKRLEEFNKNRLMLARHDKLAYKKLYTRVRVLLYR
jgi:hypothetical protein